MRFAIRIDWWWRPFMLFVAATPSNSYVELGEREIRLRFGAAFNHTIQREDVVSAGPMSWPLINGLGVRAGGRIMGLIGSTSGVVALEFAHQLPPGIRPINRSASHRSHASASVSSASMSR